MVKKAKSTKTTNLMDDAAGASRWADSGDAPESAALYEPPSPAEEAKHAWSRKAFAFASGSSYGDTRK